MYTGSVGLANQIHDYNVHVDRSDVFWMIPVRHNAVEADFDDGRARLRVRNMELLDAHDLANSLPPKFYHTSAGLPSDHLPVETMNTLMGSGLPLNCGFNITGDFG